MKNYNIYILAENDDASHGLSIYIVYSGHREYLMFHRHNAFLHRILKDGVRLDEFFRMTPRRVLTLCDCPRSSAEKLVNSLRYLKSEIYDRLAEKAYWQLTETNIANNYNNAA